MVYLSNAGSFQKLPEAVSLQDHASGDIFEQGGNYYKTNTVEGNVVAGTPLTDVAFELLDSTAVSLESHASGDIFEQGGNYYKTNTVEGSVVAGTPLTDVAFELLDPAVSWLNRLPGEIFEQGGNYYKTDTEGVEVLQGTPLTDVAFELLDSTAVSLEDHVSGDIFEQGGNYYKTNTVEGSVVAGTPLTDVAFELLDSPVSIRDHASGEIFEQDGKYYKTVNVESVVVAGTPLTDAAFELTNPELVSLKDRKEGDFFEQEGTYYKALSDFDLGTSLEFSKIEPVTTSSLQKDSIFEHDGIYYRVLENVEAGTLLESDSFDKFVEPVSLSDYSSGDIFKQEGGYYEALDDIPIGTPLSDVGSFLLKSDPVSLEAYEKGSFFSQNGKFYQALGNIPSGTPLSIGSAFIEIDPRKIPSNGDLTAFPETLRRFSDLDTFKSGDQIYFEGDFYQATSDITPVTFFDINENQTTNYTKGDVIKVGENYYQLKENLESEDVDSDLIISNSIEIGTKLPLEFEEIKLFPLGLGNNDLQLSKSYDKGDVFKILDASTNEFKYFEVENQLLRKELFNVQFDPTDSEKWILYNNEGNGSEIFAREIENPALGYAVSVPFSEGPAQTTGIYKKDDVEINVVFARAQSVEGLKLEESPVRFVQNEIYYTQDPEGNYKHFVVTDSIEIESDPNFNAFDEQWTGNFRFFTPQLVEEGKPDLFFKRSHPNGYYDDIEKESLIKLNIGTAEAVINNGEITGFNILSSGSNIPKSESIYVDGRQINVSSGSINGYQSAKSSHLDKFREDLNTLVSNLIEKMNSLYNETGSPGDYLFGFDAILSRPNAGRNSLMEENYGLFGREGDATLKLYREEVSMQLPYAETETYNILIGNDIHPEDFLGEMESVRGFGEVALKYSPDTDSINYDYTTYASSSRRTGSAPLAVENDPSFPGEDRTFNTSDDGRSYLKTHQTIPYRIEVDGPRIPVVGDNFSFDATPSNPWNLAASLKLQDGLTVDSIVKNKQENEGSGDFALKIAELASGEFLEDIALLNSNIGNSLSSISDNLEHQQSIESVLLDQRRAVSSVSIDEEVADLMRFQRSFQASSRVLNTLDKMLEIVVMGLVK